MEAPADHFLTKNKILMMYKSARMCVCNSVDSECSVWDWVSSSLEFGFSKFDHDSALRGIGCNRKSLFLPSLLLAAGESAKKVVRNCF